MKNKKRAGITLIELILAISLLLIIVVPLGNMFLTSNRLNVMAQDITIASLTAQLFVEENIGLTVQQLELRHNNLSISEDPNRDDIELLNGTIEGYWNGFFVEAEFTQQYFPPADPSDPNATYTASGLVDLEVSVRATSDGNVLAQHHVTLNTTVGGL